MTAGLQSELMIFLVPLALPQKYFSNKYTPTMVVSGQASTTTTADHVGGVLLVSSFSIQ
jgi:hypothetical protein